MLNSKAVQRLAILNYKNAEGEEQVGLALETDPPRLSRKSEKSGVGLPGQDHSLEVLNLVRGLCCGGSCNGQSASVSHR